MKKISIDNVNNKLDYAEELISKFKGRSFEVITVEE